jgi:hypothetical protein
MRYKAISFSNEFTAILNDIEDYSRLYLKELQSFRVGLEAPKEKRTVLTMYVIARAIVFRLMKAKMLVATYSQSNSSEVARSPKLMLFIKQIGLEISHCIQTISGLMRELKSMLLRGGIQYDKPNVLFLEIKEAIKVMKHLVNTVN